MTESADSMNVALAALVEIHPRGEGFEVIRDGHRRGRFFANLDDAILHGEGIAPRVAVLNRCGKLERTVRSRGILAALLAEHYAALAGDVRKDRDGHWQISCRWSYGEPVGWFVEHDGYVYDGLDADGEDGPHESREAAERCMAEHLRLAIAEARRRCP